jgi:hypothetical protein
MAGFSEAFAHGELQWSVTPFRRTMWRTMSKTLALCVVFACAGRTIIRSRAAVPAQESLFVDVCLGDAECVYE